MVGGRHVADSLPGQRTDGGRRALRSRASRWSSYGCGGVHCLLQACVAEEVPAVALHVAAAGGSVPGQRQTYSTDGDMRRGRCGRVGRFFTGFPPRPLQRCRAVAEVRAPAARCGGVVAGCRSTIAAHARRGSEGGKGLTGQGGCWIHTPPLMRGRCGRVLTSGALFRDCGTVCRPLTQI